MVTVVVILPDADVDEDCVELTLSVMDGVWVMVAVPDRVIDEEIVRLCEPVMVRVAV